MEEFSILTERRLQPQHYNFIKLIMCIPEMRCCMRTDVL